MSNIILPSELADAEKLAKQKQQAINKASFLIDDAKARYIKEKTRARSRKAAMQRDAELTSKRFNVLSDYERFEDIQEAYGCDCITEHERDRLEDLWNEREEIRNRKDDSGMYHDDVTHALHEAWVYIQDLWMDEIDKAAVMRKQFDYQQKESDEANRAVLARERRACDGETK